MEPSSSGSAFLGLCPILPVSDVERTAAFYRDKLGFSVSFICPGTWVVLRRGSVEIHLEQSGRSNNLPSGEKGGVSIRVTDVEALCAELQQRGAPFDQGPMNQEYGHRDFSIIDPNGYRLRFWQPLDDDAERTMKLPDFLTEWPYGEIVLTGHRIGLYHVVYHHKGGESAEQIHERYPTLSLELIRKVLAFYRENQPEVDAYVAREQQEIERQRASTPPAFNPEELRARYEEKKRAFGG
jgi:uncharacterized protein (DUF433 family)/catechol 2,3-dioxygenase-like lactoylglutathione lyase family enzyme